jgi:hypothetical protein
LFVLVPGRQEKKKLSSEVEVLTHRQNESGASDMATCAGDASTRCPCYANARGDASTDTRVIIASCLRSNALFLLLIFGIKTPDINEEHLNEKLKAITEKCQAVLMHNSKLQEQVRCACCSVVVLSSVPAYLTICSLDSLHCSCCS